MRNRPFWIVGAVMVGMTGAGILVFNFWRGEVKAFQQAHCRRDLLDSMSSVVQAYYRINKKPPETLDAAMKWVREAVELDLEQDFCRISARTLKSSQKGFEISFRTDIEFVKYSQGSYEWTPSFTAESILRTYELVQLKKQPASTD